MAALNFGFGSPAWPQPSAFQTTPGFPTAASLGFGMTAGSPVQPGAGALAVPSPANIAVAAPVAAPVAAAPTAAAAMGGGGSVGGITRPMARPDSVMEAAAGAAGVPGQPGGAGGWWDQIGGLEGIGSIANVLGQIGNIWGAFQGVRMARDQMDFARDSYNTNLGNQTQSYNTALEDRIRSRTRYTGGSEADVDAYLSRHALPDRRV